MITTIRIIWALRPISDRAMARRIRRNAADPAYWRDVEQAFAVAFRAGIGAAR